jgi:hypothetical protein
MAINFQQYLLQESYTRILNILRGDVPAVNSMAIVTAWNPMGVKADAKENNKANTQLKKFLRDAHYYAFPVTHKIMGMYGNVEKSFLVPHIDRKTTIVLASHFKQKAVIWGSKKKDQDQTFIDFEWIETSGNDSDKVSPETYSTTQRRKVVVSGNDAQSRADYFSASPFPKGNVDKARKFVIPFFDDAYTTAQYAQGKRTIDTPAIQLPQPEDEPATGTESYDPSIIVDVDVSFISSELPDRDEIRNLVEEIREYAKVSQDETKTGKHRWIARAHLRECLQKMTSEIRK